MTRKGLIRRNTNQPTNQPFYPPWSGLKTTSTILLQGVEILLRNWWSCFTEYQQPPWGHVVSTIKRAPTGDSSLFSTPTAVSNMSIRSSPWRQTYLVPSTSQEPRATNARAELKGTGHTAKFQQAFYLQTLP